MPVAQRLGFDMVSPSLCWQAHLPAYSRARDVRPAMHSRSMQLSLLIFCFTAVGLHVAPARCRSGSSPCRGISKRICCGPRCGPSWRTWIDSVKVRTPWIAAGATDLHLCKSPFGCMQHALHCRTGASQHIAGCFCTRDNSLQLRTVASACSAACLAVSRHMIVLHQLARTCSPPCCGVLCNPTRPHAQSLMLQPGVANAMQPAALQRSSCEPCVLCDI